MEKISKNPVSIEISAIPTQHILNHSHFQQLAFHITISRHELGKLIGNQSQTLSQKYKPRANN